jgi:hypothetical protein
MALAEDKRDGALGGQVMEARQVRDPPRVEDDKRVKARGIDAGADGLPPVPVLGRRDGGPPSVQ